MHQDVGQRLAVVHELAVPMRLSGSTPNVSITKLITTTLLLKGKKFQKSVKRWYDPFILKFNRIIRCFEKCSYISWNYWPIQENKTMNANACFYSSKQHLQDVEILTTVVVAYAYLSHMIWSNHDVYSAWRSRTSNGGSDPSLYIACVIGFKRAISYLVHSAFANTESSPVSLPANINILPINEVN